jgi:adenosylhomocysteine nucleosidase
MLGRERQRESTVTVLAVTGLKREAEIVGVQGVVAVAGGGHQASLDEGLEALHGDIKGVISVGLAGALSPLLKVGEVVIADQVITKSETWPCASEWRVALAARLPAAHQGPVAASEIILEDAETKRALHNATGALAVDMESAIAGRFASRRNLPFAVLRVISDDAAHALPKAALVAMKPGGEIAFGRVLGSLLRHPFQLPALIRTARTSNKAFKELLRCANLLGVGLARPDL